MRNIGLTTMKLAAALTALTAIASPALADSWHHRDRHHDRRDWDDRRHDDRRDWDRRHYSRYDDDDVRLRGPGVNDLNPWFRNAKSGREYAARRAGSHISERDAWMLNREFRYRDGW